jgi:hypothetical protein
MVKKCPCCIETKVHYHFYNSLPIYLILSQCNQSVSWHLTSSWTILTVSFHICLCLIHDYSLLYFLTKILCEFLIYHLFYISCMLWWWRAQIMKVFAFSCSLLGPNVFLIDFCWTTTIYVIPLVWETHIQLGVQWQFWVLEASCF